MPRSKGTLAALAACLLVIAAVLVATMTGHGTGTPRPRPARWLTVEATVSV